MPRCIRVSEDNQKKKSTRTSNGKATAASLIYSVRIAAILVATSAFQHAYLHRRCNLEAGGVWSSTDMREPAASRSPQVTNAVSSGPGPLCWTIGNRKMTKRIGWCHRLASRRAGVATRLLNLERCCRTASYCITSARQRLVSGQPTKMQLDFYPCHQNF